MSAQGQLTERLSLCRHELEKITPISEFEEGNGQEKVLIFREENLKKLLTSCFKYSVMDVSGYKCCCSLSSPCTHRHTPDLQCPLKYLPLAGAGWKGERLWSQSSYHCKILSLSSQQYHFISLCLAFPVINQINIITGVL